jgi:hypothetical protein
MALETECLTDGCVYHTHVGPEHLDVTVDFPTTLELTKEQAGQIEKLLHNQVELVIAHALQTSRRNKIDALNS